MSTIVRSSLKQFLHTSRQSLLASVSAKKPVHIVIGNQSADIDSFASSILYAFYRPSSPPTIPFLSIPRSDLSLRPEILHLCTLLSIATTDLSFTDDPPLSSLNPNSTISLVDHGRLEPNLSAFFPNPSSIVSVIDHHDDEHLYPTANPRIITPSGSCSSLVTEHFQASFPSTGTIRGELARLALAAVLIDTTNMTNKVTPHDEAVLSFLEGELAKDVTEAGSELWDRKKFYKSVWNAKNNVDHMPLRDLLRKDWKEWTEPISGSPEATRKVGIASVLRELAWLHDRDGDQFVAGVKAWADERELDVVSVMTTTGRGGDFRRELLVWVVSEGAAGCLEEFARMAEGAGLGLSVWGEGRLDGDGGRRRAWYQKDLKASRKQVAPLLREAIRVAAPEDKRSKV